MTLGKTLDELELFTALGAAMDSMESYLGKLILQGSDFPVATATLT